MVKKNRTSVVPQLEQVDCACLIHDKKYSWEYVERLYSSLCRNLTLPVKLHVYTESNRIIPNPNMIHHGLEEWPGVRGPKQSWWYKIQLFNPKYHKGPLLYFDLDTVIVGNIDWIWQRPTDKFWAARDFKYLFRSSKSTINSSVMWFDTTRYSNVYYNFNPEDIRTQRARWYGDQDYINDKIPPGEIQYFDTQRVKSWRWECLDGGYDFKSKKYLKPGQGTVINDPTSVLVFHGNPKPSDVEDPIIKNYWR